MANNFNGLWPENLWHYFGEINQIPRPSKKEEKIIEYVVEFGKKQGLETLRDNIGNVLIRKAATKGMENLPWIALQSHLDMVCEKNTDTVHDFDKDPIKTRIDGEWVKATGTTLGADDGIGVAAQLAVLASDDIPHGPIECLFTIDEETGLTGAFGLEPGFLKSNILLNLDSEDEGEFFIGCAGGKDTVIELKFEKDPVPVHFSSYFVNVSGLSGGHSGDDIQKGRGNANKILNRLLWNASKKFGLRLASFDGGNLRNAIAREAVAKVCVPKEHHDEFLKFVSDYEVIARNEFRVTETGLKVKAEHADLPEYLIDEKTQENLLNSLYACPHGVIAWSMEIPNFVETSTNLASVKMQDNIIRIATSQRSSVESEKDDIADMVEATFKLAGGKVEHSAGYPGWTPNPKSAIVDLSVKSYESLFGNKPVVRAIHAGFECGLIGDKYPGMDMISFGPTIRGAHIHPMKGWRSKARRNSGSCLLDVLQRAKEL